MLELFYNKVSPWAKSSKIQKINNKIIGKIAAFLYIPYCKITRIKKSTRIVPNSVLSLTSIPERIPGLYYCLNSLVRQSLSPESIVLWLSKSDFPNGKSDLPKRILKLETYGIEIKFCNDIRSYTKIIYSAIESSNRIIITADDDVLYPEYWLEELVEAHHKDKKSVICHRAHKIEIVNEAVLPYKEWDSLSPDTLGPSFQLIPLGVGGILYPPFFFEGLNFDWEIIGKIAPTTDDIWLKIYAIKKETRTRKVRLESKEMFTVIGTQKRRLSITNVEKDNANDLSLKNLMKLYDVTVKDFID